MQRVYGSFGAWGSWTCSLGLGLLVVASCGGSDAKRKVRAEDGGASGADSGLAGDVGLPGGGSDNAPATDGGVGGAIDSAAGYAGAPEASAGGAGGSSPEPGCVPETCAPGVCLNDVCEAVTTVDSNVNLSTASLTAGRACAEGIAYSVVGIAAATATLASAPAGDCLVPGDELLLINLQGTDLAHTHVGNWELLRLKSVSDVTVTFESAVRRVYGNGNNNAGLGTASSNQRVALLRVPRFGRLVVNEGAVVTANAWNGVLGGVVALRAAQLDLAGSVSAAALGYRGGRWSNDDITCSNSTLTEAGESIGGKGTPSTLRNLGASGGLGAGTNSFNSDNAVLSTPGHAEAGQAGFNPKGRTIGELGAPYGMPDATQLTFGSGPGGALHCDVSPPQATPYLYDAMSGQAGGIVLLLVDDLQVQATGSISATPPDATRSVAFAGGYVFLRGSKLSLGDGRVTALGSTGTQPSGPFAGQTNQASPGYIVLSAASVSGTTNPPAGAPAIGL